MKQYLGRGRALAPGCGRGHEVALAVEYWLDATGLDIAPTGVAEARAQSRPRNYVSRCGHLAVN
jgi:SAM-dependent methyltransferase